MRILKRWNKSLQVAKETFNYKNFAKFSLSISFEGFAGQKHYFRVARNEN